MGFFSEIGFNFEYNKDKCGAGWGSVDGKFLRGNIKDRKIFFQIDSIGFSCWEWKFDQISDISKVTKC